MAAGVQQAAAGAGERDELPVLPGRAADERNLGGGGGERGRRRIARTQRRSRPAFGRMMTTLAARVSCAWLGLPGDLHIRVPSKHMFCNALRHNFCLYGVNSPSACPERGSGGR